jgi:hypothetical protein
LKYLNVVILDSVNNGIKQTRSKRIYKTIGKREIK